MLKKTGMALLILSLVFCGSYVAEAWGLWGHQHINRAAVFALPKPMRAFYFNHIDFITIEASIPDLRKHLLHATQEAPRHFIDADAYGKVPFTRLPVAWSKAVQMYGKRRLYKNGILPWYIQLVTQKLTTAFKQNNKTKILFLSADLAHYVGDAYQPLHTTMNYDGQLTGQKGVHSIFESLIPELYGSSFNFKTAPAQYYKNVQQASWDMIKQSHALVQPLLQSEKKIVDNWPQGQSRSEKNIAKAWHAQLKGMVASQMRNAIHSTASLWYTAWLNAGRPDLSKLDSKYTYEINRKQLHRQYRLWKKRGCLEGIQSSAED